MLALLTGIEIILRPLNVLVVIRLDGVDDFVLAGLFGAMAFPPPLLLGRLLEIILVVFRFTVGRDILDDDRVELWNGCELVIDDPTIDLLPVT